MKKIFLILVALCCVSAASAQKYGYIYSKQIFDAMPQYKSAAEELNKLAQDVQQSLEVKSVELEALYEQYEEYADRMSEADATAYANLIESKENELQTLQDNAFGEEGSITKRQKELMGPIETAVSNAVTKVAERGGYAMVFDLSAVKVTVYQSESVNLTAAVRQELGY